MFNIKKKYFLIFSWYLFSPVHASSLQQGEEFFQQGHFAQAIKQWETTLEQESDLGTSIHMDTLLHLAIAYQTLGNLTSAQMTLQQALKIATDQKFPEQEALIYSYLGDIWLAMQQIEKAQSHLEQGLILARRLNKPLLLAHLLNNLGNVQSVKKNYSEASNFYQQAKEFSKTDKSLQLQSMLNEAQVYLKLGNSPKSLASLTKGLEQVQTLKDNYEKGFHWLSLGQLLLHIRSPQAYQMAYQSFEEAFKLGHRYQHHRLKAYAKGLLGEVYEREQRYSDALQLTRQASFFSQEEKDILYLWEWQMGRILLAQNRLEEALEAYVQARDHLNPIQTRLAIGHRDASEAFQERIRPVYFGLADVLLRKAQLTSSVPVKKALLIQAQTVIEQLKAAELQDYFQDECVSVAHSKSSSLEGLEPHTAVFYPILLPERIELLLNTGDDIHQLQVPVGAEQIGRVILEFRKNLQTATHYRFAQQASQLYQWLIAPLRQDIEDHQITLMVIVPDGPLRTIPMAALYHEQTKKFLIEEMALAMTPGLTLTESQWSQDKQTINILINGLSESVQDFSSLPNVPKEIEEIGSLFSQKEVLMNENFLLENVNKILQQTPYSIIHIASHGQFDSDPKKTFLLTYDDKLTMGRLENLMRFKELSKTKPVELLTLSACQTAVGDERAALGLAGVAVKAGARSALATLWFVNDESTAQLVTEFYQQLQQPGVSKAKALQNAQKRLIGERNFRHPLYWSPFLLIGNWL